LVVSLFNKNKVMLAAAGVGFYSYGIYLFHFFIGPGAVSNFRRCVWPNAPTFVQFLIFLSADIMFGFLISSVIEQPVLRWRNRVFPPKERKPRRAIEHYYRDKKFKNYLIFWSMFPTFAVLRSDLRWRRI